MVKKDKQPKILTVPSFIPVTQRMQLANCAAEDNVDHNYDALFPHDETTVGEWLFDTPIIPHHSEVRYPDLEEIELLLTQDEWSLPSIEHLIAHRSANPRFRRMIIAFDSAKRELTPTIRSHDENKHTIVLIPRENIRKVAYHYEASFLRVRRLR